MKYRLFQYYNDELFGWNRVIEFYKAQSGELIRQITIGLDQQHTLLPPDNRNTGFIDEFMKLERNLNLVASQITSQLQRLERSIISPEDPLKRTFVSSKIR